MNNQQAQPSQLMVQAGTLLTKMRELPSQQQLLTLRQSPAVRQCQSALLQSLESVVKSFFPLARRATPPPQASLTYRSVQDVLDVFFDKIEEELKNPGMREEQAEEVPEVRPQQLWGLRKAKVQTELAMEHRFKIEQLAPWRVEQPMQVQPDPTFSWEPGCFTLVETQAQLDQMLSHLSEQQEIAVDLQHHSQHSYLGFTCLIQISTHKRDFVVDPFPLWPMLGRLNSVFMNQNILKVFHGSYNDVLWLKEDFGVYIVNLYDSYFVAKFLQASAFNLQYLLSNYLSVYLDKAHQLSDWRERPISQAKLLYARKDTHYLLDLKKAMLNSLAKKCKEYRLNPLEAMAQIQTQCKKQCLFQPVSRQNYQTEESAQKIITRSGKRLSGVKQDRLHKILAMRDQRARELDQSPEEVLGEPFIKKLLQKTRGATFIQLKKLLHGCKHKLNLTRLQQFMAQLNSKPTQEKEAQNTQLKLIVQQPQTVFETMQVQMELPKIEVEVLGFLPEKSCTKKKQLTSRFDDPSVQMMCAIKSRAAIQIAKQRKHQTLASQRPTKRTSQAVEIKQPTAKPNVSKRYRVLERKANAFEGLFSYDE